MPMTDEERAKIEALLAEVKRCISRRTPVRYGGAVYVPAALILRKPPQGWLYSVELVDQNAKRSTVTVGLEDVNWKEGTTE